MRSSNRFEGRFALWSKASGKAVFIALVALLAIAGDGLLITAVIDLELPLAAAAAGHLVVATASFALVHLWLRDWSAGVILGLWVGLLGPLGAIAATLAIVFSSSSKGHSIEDEAWYQRLKGGEELDNELVTALRDHRAYEGERVSLHSFRKIMDGGSVSQKQTILGLIAQSYEPAFSGLLMDALCSPEVAVRASAAAVFARLRDKQAADLRAAELLAQSRNHEDVLEAATRFANAASSGLLSQDDSEKARLQAIALRRGLSRLDVVPLAIGQLDERLKVARRASQGSGPGALPKRLPREHDTGGLASWRAEHQP